MQKVRQEPRNSLWLIYLGDFLQSKQMEKKAVNAYERALKLSPMNAELNNNLAWLLLTARDASIRDANRALTVITSYSIHYTKLYDMVRNDLGRVAQPGTVQVEQLFATCRYPTLWQMTSRNNFV